MNWDQWLSYTMFPIIPRTPPQDILCSNLYTVIKQQYQPFYYNFWNDLRVWWLRARIERKTLRNKSGGEKET